MTPSSTSAVAVRSGKDMASLILLLVCFFASGLAALIYQTAWTRQFALLFGTSELAVATVLAAYMGGLALGARLIEPWLPRIRRAVRAYAWLEGGIAISAVLLVPTLLKASSWLLLQWFGGQSAPPSSDSTALSFYYLLAAFVALAVPTTLMGATLPLLARHAVFEERQIGGRIGLLYAINTAGAVAGALLTAYTLLPALGLSATIWVAAGVNFLVFLLAVLLAQSAPVAAAAPAASDVAQPHTVDWRAPPAAAWILPLMLLSGAAAFLHEVLWSRMLSHLVGGSIHAFAVMVASFLAGIALGGAAGAALARSRERAIAWFIAAQFATAIAAGAAYVVLLGLAPYTGGLKVNTWLGLTLLLPMTFAIGTTYPLAVRILAARAEQAAAASARVYAWNTVGAIVGAIAGGFAIIPALRYEGTIKFAVLLSAVLGVAALWLLQRPRLWIAGAVTALALLGAFLHTPPRPDALLATSPLNVDTRGRILYYDVGRSASVVMLAQDGGLALRTNGLPEALMDTPGLAPRFSGEFWLSPIASILRPQARSMLVVGYGGGVVVEGVAPGVGNIDVIELEPEVIAANRATRQLRRRDPLNDARLRLVTNDARGALQLTDKRYDAIVSQPSHPWTAGASHLYTREFMQIARQHLVDDGVFVQWMNVAFVNESLLRSLTATLIDVFGRTRIYRPDPNTLVFVASSAALAPEARLLTTAVPLALSPAHFARYGINAAEDLLYALAADEAGAARLAQGAALITDDRNRIATSTVFNLGEGMSADAAGRVLAPYDPLQEPQSWVYRQFGSQLSFEYIVRRSLSFAPLDPSMFDRSQRIITALGSNPQARNAQYVLLVSRGEREPARQLARETSALWPDDATSRYLWLQSEFNNLGADSPSAEFATAAARLPPSAQSALLGPGRAARGEFGQIAAADALLVEARPTDIWYIDAQLLRADWRSRVTNEDRRRQLGDEAIEIIDQVLLAAPSSAAYAMRLAAAGNADRPEVMLESLNSLASWDLAILKRPVSAEQLGRIRSRVAGLQQVLDERSRDARLSTERVSEVNAKLAELKSLLEKQN